MSTQKVHEKIPVPVKKAFSSFFHDVTEAYLNEVVTFRASRASWKQRPSGARAPLDAFRVTVIASIAHFAYRTTTASTEAAICACAQAW